MVLKECMGEIRRLNPAFQRPDMVQVDLLYDKLPNLSCTPMGKVFYCLIVDIWQKECILKQWNEVLISNLYKTGDPEDTNNYQGISLISLALKVLLSLMANRLSIACEQKEILSYK